MVSDETFEQQIRRSNLFRTVLFWRNFDRAPGHYWVFVSALAFSFFWGLAFGAGILFWVSAAIVLFCVVPAVIFAVMKLK